MSNLPPNPYGSGPPSMNANMNQNDHNQSFSPVPASQLPPGYGSLKRDSHSNSPLPSHPPLQNNTISHVNNYNQSGGNSPAFNNPGAMPPPSGPQSPPMMRPMMQPPSQVPFSNTSQPPSSIAHSSSLSYPPNYQHQINNNAPPLVPSSHSTPLVNGPPVSGPILSQPTSHYPSASGAFSSPLYNSSSQNLGPGHINPPLRQPGGPPVSRPTGSDPISPPNVPFSSPMVGQPSSPLVAGPHITVPPTSGPPISGPPTSGPNLSMPPTSGTPMSGLRMSGPPMPGPSMSGPPTSGPPISGPPHTSGPPTSRPPTLGFPITGSSINQNAPSSGPPVNGPPLSGSMSGPSISGPSMSRPPNIGPPLSGPPTSSLVNTPPISGQPLGSSTTGPPLSRPMGVNGPSSFNSSMTAPIPGPPSQGYPPNPTMPPTQRPPLGAGPSKGLMSNNASQPFGAQGPPSMPGQFQPSSMAPPMPPGSQIPPNPQMSMGQQSGMGQQPNMPPGVPIGPTNMPPGVPSGPTTMPPKTNTRYPASNNFGNHYPSIQTQTQQPYPQQYNTQNLTQQMGQLSVTKQGFDQLWGHQMVDLLQVRHILPEYPDEPPEIKLTQQFADAPNCSPEIFRCTINRIPETNNLLQKSRLPLGILIHPFKDLNHLPVIQCNTIVRCRACRTYINPFVYFVDGKRWKCNLCYRVNDLPEEFQYDPVSRSYGDPCRRPEIKSATIEFIAPGEYMLRPPQPAVYLFLMDISQLARDSGYLQIVCETLKENIDSLPGDARTQVGFICYDAHVHCYLLGEGLLRPKEITILDIDDVFLPSPDSLLVNLGERKALVLELLAALPQRHSPPATPASALGAALQLAYKLMSPTGGRITVFQTCLPNIGPGALQSREDPNARSSAEVAHLNPATDFYKRLALDCSGAQVAVDLFLLNSQYSDLATLSGMSRFSGGTVYHIPLFNAARRWQAEQLARMLTRYLTRKIGFEAVMRVRCTRGIGIHTFHGNFFVRSTDLLSLPNVSPDAGFGMQLTIEESLSDLQQVCFQAALLYTSSKGERRIRVHTLALPVASNLTEVLFAADQQAIVGLLSKMAVDRCATASLSEAREALTNVAVDALSAFRLAQNLPAGAASGALHAPHSLRLLPLYLLGLLKTKAFRSGTSTRLDDRVAFMCQLKSLPLPQLLRCVYPELYPIHSLREYTARAEDEDDDDNATVEPDPPRLHLSAERISSNGAYLLDDGETMIIYVCHAVSASFLSDTFGVTAFSQVRDDARSLPRIDSEGNTLLHAFIHKLNDDRPHAANILVLKDNSPNRTLFTERLVDDRVESAFAYYEFLQHVKNQVK